MTTKQGLNSTKLARGPSSPLVAISILNWNGWEDTLECLESVRKLDYPNYLTIVIDNGSSNDSAERIKAWAEGNLGPSHVLADYRRETSLHGGEVQTEQALDHAPSPGRLVLIRSEENLGFTGGNNVAFRYALSRRGRADYLFMLNNDATVKRDTLNHLVSTAIESDAGVVGAVVIGKDRPDDRFEGPCSFLYGFFMPPLSPLRRKPDKRKRFWPSDFVSGAAMLIRGEVLEEVHDRTGEYLSSKLFMFWDEQAFCLQVHRAGHSCVFSRDATVDHDWGKSSNRRIRGYYVERNKILLANMALPFKWKLVFHVMYVPMGLSRVGWAALRGKTILAKTLLLSLCDGYRGIGGKWKYHDQ